MKGLLIGRKRVGFTVAARQWNDIVIVPTFIFLYDPTH
jgi:hypothetical protein